MGGPHNHRVALRTAAEESAVALTLERLEEVASLA